MVIDFVKSNSEWIKNAVIATCTLIGAVIAILTYNKAKVSILQSEVAKEQTKKLNEILSLLNGFKELYLINLYYEILLCNLYEYAKQFGQEFYLSDSSGQEKKDGENNLKELRDGWLILDISTESFFNDVHQEIKPSLSHPAKGFKRIDALYITRSYNDFATQMCKYADDPFLPKFVSANIIKILKEVESNLREPLAHELDIHLDYLASSEFSQPIWPQAIFNQFNDKRIHHNKTIIKLINRLRRYLSL